MQLSLSQRAPSIYSVYTARISLYFYKKSLTTHKILLDLPLIDQYIVFYVFGVNRMFMIKLPMWIRIVLWVIRAVAKADPPTNGDLDEDEKE